jgi:hypothetical protein
MNRRRHFFFAAAILASELISTSACFAADPLTGEQMKALFTGKTADVYNVAAKHSIKAYFAPDGSLKGRNLTAGKDLAGKWEVDAEGLHCTESNLAPKSCGSVTPQGDGTYHRTVDGKHTQTFSNFVDGNPANY